MQGDARLIVEAFALATKAHAFTKRRDGRVPYIGHPAEMAVLLARREPPDPVLIAAALLHDVVEDGAATDTEIRAKFGDEVADVVAECTDPPGMKKKARHERQIAHAATASERAKLLKIADKISNVAELADLPKALKSPGARRKYLDFASRVVGNCRGVDPVLEAAFDSEAARLAAIISKLEKGKSK